MLRPFSLVSNPLEYDAGAGGIAEVRMPATPKGSARCAITGIRHNSSGTAGVVEIVNGWGTRLQRLSVAGRNYFQGETPFPLISGETTIGSAPFAFPYANRFLGSHIPLPGATALGDGAIGSGIAFGPSDEVRLRVERLTEDAFVDRIVFDCVQFPDDPRDPENQIWEALHSRGLGEAHFVGSRQTGYLGAGSQVIFDEYPQPPSARALRRTGFRAAITDEAGFPVYELGDPAATTMNNLLAQVWSSFQRAPQNQLAPIRAIMGLIGYETPTGLVDFQADERSMVQILFAGTALPDPDLDIWVLHMFEGRDIDAPTLEAANAIS